MPHYRLSELEIHHNNNFVQGHVIQTVIKRFYGSLKKNIPSKEKLTFVSNLVFEKPPSLTPKQTRHFGKEGLIMLFQFKRKNACLCRNTSASSVSSRFISCFVHWISFPKVNLKRLITQNKDCQLKGIGSVCWVTNHFKKLNLCRHNAVINAEVPVCKAAFSLFKMLWVRWRWLHFGHACFR